MLALNNFIYFVSVISLVPVILSLRPGLLLCLDTPFTHSPAWSALLGLSRECWIFPVTFEFLKRNNDKTVFIPVSADLQRTAGKGALIKRLVWIFKQWNFNYLKILLTKIVYFFIERKILSLIKSSVLAYTFNLSTPRQRQVDWFLWVPGSRSWPCLKQANKQK